MQGCHAIPAFYHALGLRSSAPPGLSFSLYIYVFFESIQSVCVKARGAAWALLGLWSEGFYVFFALDA